MASDLVFLIVDDDIQLLSILSRMVRRISPGAQISTYTTVRDALQILKQKRITCLITDYQLDTDTGMTLIQAARATTKPPILLLISGSLTEKLYKDAVAAGCDAVLHYRTEHIVYADSLRKERIGDDCRTAGTNNPSGIGR